MDFLIYLLIGIGFISTSIVLFIVFRYIERIEKRLGALEAVNKTNTSFMENVYETLLNHQEKIKEIESLVITPNE